MNKLISAAVVALGILCSLVCSQAARAQEAIPPGLREWQGWVLHGEEFRRCPFAAAADTQAGTPIPAHLFRCVWPERLTLAVDARGGTFSQRWQVYSESWVELPGDSETWPRDVRLNGAAAAVVARDDVPSVRLAPGTHTLSGRFEWSSRPEALPLPGATAIVELFVDGSRVAQPERPDGGVWLGKRRSTEQAAAMEVQVYRLVQDEIPAYLLTRIRLNVAGEAREEVLGRALPDGFTPLSLQGDLPARLERDGTLRVQLRAGSHEVILFARGTGVAGALARPDNSSGKWPREEIWSFAANDALRVAAAEGAEGIDPAQANVPAEWRQYPAFRMDAAAKLTVSERSRGLSNADDNRLTLARAIWLDFDHRGFTVVDSINGLMRRDWRLDMQAPFALQSARQNDDQLLVTEGDQGRAGVELRQPRLYLTTVARKESGGGAMPATGWDTRFDRVTGKLNLPVGHRLIAAIGTDGAPGAWWERWGLWNVFGVLLIVGFVYWTAGLIPAAIAALALVLTYQEMPEFIWLWGNLLAALAIARAAPAGRFQRFASAYRTVSFVVLGIALLPFLWLQVRYALYPQLAPNDATYGIMANISRGQVLPSAMAPQEEMYAMDAAAPAVAAAAPPAPDAIMAEDIGKFPDRNVSESLQRLPGVSLSKGSGLNAAQVVQRYAAGTVLQAGPGIPAWGYNSYDYYWSGPVESADTVRFIYVGPAVLFFWRIAGVIALAALFAWLALLSYGKRVAFPGFPKAASAALLPGLLATTLLLLSLGAGSPAQAAAEEPGSPGTDLLAELKTRLTAAPPCAPECVEISAARVTVQGDRLEVTLQVSALATVAVAMPHASDRWQLDDVSVDARSTLAMARDGDASLWVPITAGAHTVRLAGRLASAESIQLAFPQRPRVIDVSAHGWTTSGVNEGRLVSGSLELARERVAERSGDALEAGAEFPAFVRVDRVFHLDLDWTLDTIVTRIAPQRAALSVEIPLVKGESVLSDGVKVRDNAAAIVGLATGERQTQWHSGLARAETLEVSVPADAARSEVWSFVVNPQWNVAFEGFAPVLPEDVNAPSWVFRFMPRPGEKLSLTVTRPKGAKGTTLAIDSASLHTTVGARSSTTTLQFSYRSTQGGRHVIKLPEQARVTGVTFDSMPQQLRPEKGELPLSLAPGAHSMLITWEESRDVGLVTHPSKVDLRSAASNLTFGVQLPDSRWILAAWGPGVGPAVLYWGELVIFVVVAWLLGRWAKSPLRFTDWLLLGLGLSTQSWSVFCLTAVWLIAIRWREDWKPADDFSRARFNAVQLLLAALTFISVLTLLFSGIRNGLLAYPDMHIAGSGGYGGYTWFQDQTAGMLDGPSIVSVPMWVYRLLMLAWAGWMAFALVRWLRWAFNSWKTNGLWRAKYPAQ